MDCWILLILSALSFQNFLNGVHGNPNKEESLNTLKLVKPPPTGARRTPLSEESAVQAIRLDLSKMLGKLEATERNFLPMVQSVSRITKARKGSRKRLATLARLQTFVATRTHELRNELMAVAEEIGVNGNRVSSTSVLNKRMESLKHIEQRLLNDVQKYGSTMAKEIVMPKAKC